MKINFTRNSSVAAADEDCYHSERVYEKLCLRCVEKYEMCVERVLFRFLENKCTQHISLRKHVIVEFVLRRDPSLM